MTFAIESTSVETAATRRLLRVMQRSNVAGLIDHAGVFACRKVAGSVVWSDHSWGAAADLFAKHDAAASLAAIAHNVVVQTTQRTTANRGRRLAVRYVINHEAGLIWTPTLGWHEYGGTRGPHVHVSTGLAPSGTPPCAQ